MFVNFFFIRVITIRKLETRYPGGYYLKYGFADSFLSLYLTVSKYFNQILVLKWASIIFAIFIKQII